MELHRNKASTLETQNSTLEKENYEDLLQGLQQIPKRIPSKYFYDSVGSDLFVRITKLDEYYLTACEKEILDKQSEDILSKLNVSRSMKLNIVELGAGDGHKTLSLLKSSLNCCSSITYRPVDISATALQDLEQRLLKEIPEVPIQPCLLDMENEFQNLPIRKDSKNVVLFLGSSLGNFTPDEQSLFLSKLHSVLNPQDCVLIGFDLKKDPVLLQKAYSDSEGVTEKFNMNLLLRLNREVGANFDTQQFRHWALFNPLTGAMESWLVSLKDQEIELAELDYKFKLNAYEAIHVETSWKFSEPEIDRLASRVGFSVIKNFKDQKEWFVDSLWER